MTRRAYGSGGGGGSGSLANFRYPEYTFNPGVTSSGNILSTWAEVQAIASTAVGPWTLIIDSSLAACEVPAGTTTDFNLFATITFAEPQSGFLTIKDTALLRNVPKVIGGAIVCEAITSTSMDYTISTRINIEQGAAIRNIATSTVPAISTGSIGFFAIASFLAGQLNNDANFGAVPLVDFALNGGFFVLASLSNSQPGESAFRTNSVISGASSILLVIYDSCDRLPSQPGFLGTYLFTPISQSNNMAMANGDTASRPTSLATNGTMYFDTTLGIPIWYDGTNWVDATGTIV